MSKHVHDHDINIENMAVLSRLQLSDDEKRQICDNLDATLTYFDKLSEVDVTDVAPSAHACPLYDVVRDDIPGSVLPVSTALKNAPAQRNNQIVVPKVVE